MTSEKRKHLLGMPSEFYRCCEHGNFSVFLKLTVFLIVAPEILVIFFQLVYNVNNYGKYSDNFNSGFL